MQKIKDILKERVLVLDGAMGTMVQGYGLATVLSQEQVDSAFH